MFLQVEAHSKHWLQFVLLNRGSHKNRFHSKVTEEKTFSIKNNFSRTIYANKKKVCILRACTCVVFLPENVTQKRDGKKTTTEYGGEKNSWERIKTSVLTDLQIYFKHFYHSTFEE